MTGHAGAAADPAFGHRPAGGRGERREQVLGAHVLPADVVEPAVPGLGDGGEAEVAACLVLPERRAGVDLAAAECVAHDAQAVRVRQRDRRGEQAALADPLETGEVAAAVERVAAGEQRLHGDLALVRDDRRDAGAHRPLPHHQRPGVALDERHAADGDAGHVGDRVQRSRRAEAELDAEVASAHQASSARSLRRALSAHHSTAPATTATATTIATTVPVLPPPPEASLAAAAFGPTLR